MKLRLELFFWIFSFFWACSRPTPTSNAPAPVLETLRPIAIVDLYPEIIEPSGIAFDAKNNSLWVVSDAKSDLFEIDFDGNILKTIPTSSSDLEGIALGPNCDTIYVVEERNQMVNCYSLKGTSIRSFPVKVATLSNNALEGIAVDLQHHIFVLNEKNPRLLLEFIGSTEIKRTEVLAVEDLSDICYDESEDCLWLVSDESRQVLKIAKDGMLLARWLIPFAAGEGITFAHGKMYLVCDADAKMYVFQKPTKKPGSSL